MQCVPCLKAVAAVATTGFAFGALSISAVSIPLLRTVQIEDRRASWNLMYNKSAPIQAGLAFLGAVSAGVVTYLTKSPVFGAVALADAFIPLFTFAVIRPKANKPLQDETTVLKKDEVTALIDKWAVLHWVRTGVAMAATLLLVAQHVGGCCHNRPSAAK